MNFKIKNNILIIESDDKIDKEIVKQSKESFEKSTNKKYSIVLWRNVIGYYSAYDFDKNCSIYCGTMSEKTSLEQINEYLKWKN